MRWLRESYLTRVLIHTREGDTYDGLLHGSERGAVLLVNASFHAADSEHSVPLAGETYIPRERISFLQKP